MRLTASVQPAHLLDDIATAERVWPGRTARCFALRAMLDHSVTVAFGSDAPVAPLDPWLAIAASVGGNGIAVGQPGDVVLLDADPLASNAERLRAMRVALTCVAGRIVHSNLDA